MKKLLVMTAALMLLCTQLYAGNGDLIVNGNLGVGTGTPAALEPFSRLTVSASDATALSTSVINEGNGQSATYWLTRLGGSTQARWGWYIPGNGTKSFNLYDGVNGSTPLTVLQSSGNVGIGTTSPAEKLHVNNGGLLLDNFGSLSLNPELSTAVRLDRGYTGGWARGYGWVDANNVTLGMIGAMGSDNSGAGSLSYIYIGKTFSQPWLTINNAGNLWIAGSLSQSSDINFKKDIQPIDAPLNKLLSLNGVSYQWKTDEYKDKGFPEGRHYGVIAQEIEKVLPEVVNTAPDGTKSVAYTEIIPVLIEAMKAQQKEINELKSLVGQLAGK